MTENKASMVIKPLITGSVAYWLGKKADTTVSHKWVVYLRGDNNEDLSTYVKEVVFTLHESFVNKCRSFTKPPYEVHEVGWGEFDIIITIKFIDETLKPLELHHALKFYHGSSALSTRKPVISENYDEVIFVNPKKWFLEILNNPQFLINPVIKDEAKSMDYSMISQNDDSNRKQATSINNLRKEKSLVGPTFERKFGAINLATQDFNNITPSLMNINRQYESKHCKCSYIWIPRIPNGNQSRRCNGKCNRAEK